MDNLTTKQRSRQMSLVRSKDTKPEMAIRRVVHALGYRYRLHVKSLPGCPDLVFPARRAVIFVHGCFWHQHRCAMGMRTPKSRIRFWRKKLNGNKERDLRCRRKLRNLGWRAMIVWECQTKKRLHERMTDRISTFLDASVLMQRSQG
jgi:DNA mismatch endonuclease (patch repair protein)